MPKHSLEICLDGQNIPQRCRNGKEFPVLVFAIKNRQGGRYPPGIFPIAVWIFTAAALTHSIRKTFAVKYSCYSFMNCLHNNNGVVHELQVINVKGTFHFY